MRQVPVSNRNVGMAVCSRCGHQPKIGESPPPFKTKRGYYYCSKCVVKMEIEA